MHPQIRRVPAGWRHPIRPSLFSPTGWGWHPLFDQTYAEACAEAGAEGESPDVFSPQFCRPDWPDETRTCFQVYEDVTEGTPISPVLPSLAAVADFLVERMGATVKGAHGVARRDQEGFINHPTMGLAGVRPAKIPSWPDYPSAGDGPQMGANDPVRRFLRDVLMPYMVQHHGGWDLAVVFQLMDKDTALPAGTEAAWMRERLEAALRERPGQDTV